ncbi:Imm26 family immunity protein [Flavobacterium sp. '19STA2R22 D10 B1']|uniref:Imm26 family immunity protein n=1 Tax=Flavobacterium aerium TaxID=3037261 RepID=UPI00278BC52D|nr:Imm26 family immunity protein [Flavobacterium sp. '19STA2R22 D10 B1']
MIRFKLKIGDIFTIPLSEKEVGFGQIVCFPNSKNAFIMCVFDIKQSKETPIEIQKICNTPLLFLGYSTDAKLYHKHWEIIGNSIKNIDSITMPYFRLGTPPKDIYLINYKGDRLKSINIKEFDMLDYETNYAPIRYENALKAHFGFGEWIPENYNNLLYKFTLDSNEIAKRILNK